LALENPGQIRYTDEGFEWVLPKQEDILSRINTIEKQKAIRGTPEYAEYLKALDAKYGQRLGKRDQDIGYGTKNWYHGTTVPIEEFKESAKGLSTGAQSAKKGFFFAEDPSTAADYAEFARQKGIVREGDTVTTKAFSDQNYDNILDDELIKDLKFDVYEKNQLANAWEKRAENTKNTLNTLPKNSEKITELQETLKNEIEQAKQYKNKAVDLQKKLEKAYDPILSGGQNVVPVRLKMNPHTKDYKSQGYRDTSYADEMSKARKKGKDSVLFKNTFDPADPYNRVQQDIAAVFNPNQIRSVNAAFDPRFADSDDILAGALAIPSVNALDSENIENEPTFQKLRGLFKGK
jgi:hypothetical protein